jgi:hypothetical protein
MVFGARASDHLAMILKHSSFNTQVFFLKGDATITPRQNRGIGSTKKSARQLRPL